MKTDHIKLEVTIISNVVTIKTLFVSDAVQAYMKKENMFCHSLTVMLDRTTQFNENSIRLGFRESDERIGYYSFTSNRRAKVFLNDMTESLAKFSEFIENKNEYEFNEGKMTLSF